MPSSARERCSPGDRPQGDVPERGPKVTARLADCLVAGRRVGGSFRGPSIHFYFISVFVVQPSQTVSVACIAITVCDECNGRSEPLIGRANNRQNLHGEGS